MQILQQPLRGREEGAAAILRPEEAGRPGPGHCEAAAGHSPDPCHLRGGKSNHRRKMAAACHVCWKLYDHKMYARMYLLT